MKNMFIRQSASVKVAILLVP